MAEFMVLVLADEADEARLSPAGLSALIEGFASFERALADALLDGERLRPSVEGARVRRRAGEAEVVRGPFEAQALAAYYVLRAESLEAAADLARACPATPGTSIEVRPIMKRRTDAQISSQPGRIFAFGVLGSASNEEGWIEVMDRIDARTRDGFPAERWLGGLRLEAPSTGRRTSSSSAPASKVIFDGPFLESKEILGGVFFLRMASLDEAVAWALTTPFVEEGALEVRELWRS
jgi:hypothetical protein